MKKLLFLIVFGCIFAGLFFLFKQDAGTLHAGNIANIPSIQAFGNSSGLEGTIQQFGPLAGLGLAVIISILMIVVRIVLKICQLPARINTWITLLMTYGVLGAFGYELVYLEETNSALASLIVYYIGKPLLYASIITLVIIVLMMIWGSITKKGSSTKTLLLIGGSFMASLLVSGCSLLGNLTYYGCGMMPDGKEAAHCYQEAALQQNDETVCDKAPQAQEFKTAGSNPPQDKCYFMVAENKRDPEVCKKIKGGMLSYSVNECMTQVLDNAEQDISTKLEGVTEGKKLSDAELLKIQKQMSDYSKMTEMMTNLTKNIHSTNQSLLQNLR